MPETIDKPRYERGSVKMKLSGDLEATLLCDLKKYSSGSLLMKIADTDLRLQDEHGKEVGSMGIAMGGTFYVSVRDGEHTRDWSIDLMKIFEMLIDAENEQYLASEARKPSA